MSNPDPRPSFERFAAERRFQPSLSFSPDGGQIAYITNTSGQFNLWRVNARGGYAHQVTGFADVAVRQVGWSPGGDRLVFAADRDGDEQYQLYLVASEAGWPEALASEPDVQHSLGVDTWSPDGRFFAYSANDRDPVDQDVSIYEPTTGTHRRLMAGNGYFQPMSWSPNGRRLVVVAATSNTDQDVHVIDVETGESRCLTPHEGDVRFYPGQWLPDGSGFLVASDLGRDFMGLGAMNAESGSVTWLETPEWDVEFAEFSADGQLLVWVTNEGGFSRVWSRPVAGGERRAYRGVPEGTIDAFTVARGGRLVAFTLQSATKPPELYSLDLDSGETIRLTDGFLGGIAESALIAPEIVHIPSTDGFEVPAFVYRPEGAGPFGVVLSIHGGPEWQERTHYDALYQYLLSRGIGILAPNIRGSTGYGKRYQYAIHRDWGGGDLEDFRSAAEYLRSLPWVDPKRMGVFGGSYGGFATLSCVTRLPEYWAAGVDIVGPSNLVTFAKAVPPTWRRFMTKWVGDPETEAEFLMERSPITYVDQVRCPLFVIQGANDPRVVKAESDQIVERLRARGVEVRYDVYEDEGHGFTRRANRLRAMKDSAEFLERHLGGMGDG